jgi:hypothetical protein
MLDGPSNGSVQYDAFTGEGVGAHFVCTEAAITQERG